MGVSCFLFVIILPGRVPPPPTWVKNECQHQKSNQVLHGQNLLSYPLHYAGSFEMEKGQAYMIIYLSLSPILTFDILESIKPALKLDGALW